MKLQSACVKRITLLNSVYISAAHRGLVPDAELFGLTLDGIPDSCAYTLAINSPYAPERKKSANYADKRGCSFEEVRQKGGCGMVETVKSCLTDGSTARCGVMGLVEIRENRCLAGVHGDEQEMGV